MFFLNREALEHIFEGLESGFRRTPEEILLFVILLAGFVSLLIAIYFIQLIWRRSRRRKRAAQRFSSIIEEKRISAEERRVLEDMVQQLSKWREQLASLVTDVHTFNRAAEKYLRKNPRADSAVAALRLKLGFSGSDGEKVIRSSADLAEGLRVYIRQDKRHSFSGTVAAQKPEAMVLQLPGDGNGPSEGDELQVYFLRKNGVFFFTTHVRRAHDNILRVEHSEEISRVQRRQFYRGRVSLSAVVKKRGSSQPAVRTYILELGGGGLTLFNPYKMFHPGDQLSLRFTLPEHGELQIGGRVRRSDRGGNHVHVEFDPIKEAVRDKILGFVLNRAMSSS
jgi:c-di-GMP-binding flagellar brake protein YcgR